jgi:AraC-like DNA-binding protein
MENSTGAQLRLRSSWSDARWYPAQGPDQSEPLAPAALPRGRMRLLLDQPASVSASSSIGTQSERITWPQGQPRISGQARPRRLAGRGLAGWQRLAVVAYTEKHITERIATRALARFVYLSSSCFRRAFKRSFGIPPHRYLVQRRIERAKELLASSALSIGQIGIALGFSQTGSFSATFRHVTGITPTDYRRARSLQEPAEKGA